jgi:hypothetical protein
MSHPYSDVRTAQRAVRHANFEQAQQAYAAAAEKYREVMARSTADGEVSAAIAYLADYYAECAEMAEGYRDMKRAHTMVVPGFLPPSGRPRSQSAAPSGRNSPELHDAVTAAAAAAAAATLQTVQGTHAPHHDNVLDAVLLADLESRMVHDLSQTILPQLATYRRRLESAFQKAAINVRKQNSSETVSFVEVNTALTSLRAEFELLTADIRQHLRDLVHLLAGTAQPEHRAMIQHAPGRDAVSLLLQHKHLLARESEQQRTIQDLQKQLNAAKEEVANLKKYQEKWEQLRAKAKAQQQHGVASGSSAESISPTAKLPGRP